MTAARHRAPPLWVRLNQPTPHRVAVLALATFGTFALGVAGIADGVGDGITPARSSAALPSRAEEPTGRGGPVAPIFTDVDAPQYEPEPPYAPQSPASVNTGQGQRTAAPRSAAVTTAPARPVPVAPTPTPTPAQPAPAEPEPVVGLPVIEPAEPAAPPAPVIEEEPPVTETEPTPVVVEPTATPVTEPPLAEEAS